MSHNQTRADRSDGQLRRPGRSGGGSGHHRGTSSAAWKAASGSGRPGAPPVPAVSPAPVPDASYPQTSVAASRSFKKPGNGQGVQQQDGVSQVAASVPARSVQNGLHPPPASGVHDGSSSSSHAAGIVPKASKPLPRPPPSQSHSGSSDSAAPKTPMKGDSANPFPLQFGSISPGFMNGMKIPARTSSAPPNLDEQKRDQAQHGHSMALPPTSISSVPKQHPQQQQQQQQNQPQLPKKEGAVPSQPKVGESQPSLPSKREPNTAVAHQSSAISLPGISMPVFQNPHVQMQFGGASPQMQSQNAGAASLQMQMLPLTVGAQQIQPPVFFPALPHTLQSQGIMHQTHGLNFPPQMGHQLPPQIGNLGMGIGTQYTQQQTGALGGPRKTSVKITDPKTREELRLDKRNDLSTDSSIQKSQVSMQHQSQPPPTFAPSHQVTYYQGMQPGTFNPSQMYLSSSLPLPSMQMTTNSQPPRLNFSFGQAGPPISIVNPTASISKSGVPSNIDSVHLRHSHDGHSLPISAPSASVRVTVKPPPDHLSSRKAGITVTPASVVSIPKDEVNKMVKLPDDSVLSRNMKGSEASGQQPTSSASIERNSASSYLDVSNQKIKPIVAVEISESKTSVTDDSNETMKKSGLLKDSQKRMSQKDIGLTQQQIQTVLLDPVSSPKLHAIRSPRNISSDVIPELELKSSSLNKDMLETGEKPMSLEEISSSAIEEGTSSDAIPCEIKEDSPVKVTQSHSSEVNKMVKLPDDSVLSRNVKGNEVSGQQPTSSSNIERNNPPSYLDVSIQRTKPSVAVEISESKIPVPDDRSETMKKSGALKDSQKRTSEKDIGLTQQQIQTGLLDSVSSTKLHTIRSPRDIASDVIPELELKGSSTNQDLERGEKPVSLEEISSSAVEEGTSSDAVSCEIKEDYSVKVTQSHSSEVNEIYEPKTLVTDDRNEAMKKSGLLTDSQKRMGQKDIGLAQQQIQTALLDSVSSPNLHAIRSPRDIASDVIPEPESEMKGSSTNQDMLETGEKPVSLEEISSSAVEEGTSADAISCEIKEDSSVKVAQSHSSVVSEVLDKPMEVIKSMATTGKKKKKKEMLSKADAEGMNSDLYMAYKGTNEKQENNNTIASVASSVTVAEQVQYGDTKELDITCNEEAEQGRGELDDWEDVVEVSSPKLSDNLVLSESDKSLTNEGESGLISKRYSRDFLLTFSGQYLDLPAGFEIGSDIANAIMNTQIGSSRNLGRDQYAGSARIIDRPSSASRVDRRSGNTLEDDKWSKGQAASAFIRDLRPDLRSGQGINQGVLRNPRGQSNQYSGGILSNSLQSPGASKSNMEADRWARGTGIQRGLIPPPSTPAQVMHKAEKKYVVGKVSDEEESKQRQLKGILNKLTPQNFDRLFEQVKEVNIDSVNTLRGVISQIFDKALMEPTFCEMYANFCAHLAGALPDFTEENEKITFRRLLLNKCQEEFERGEREQAEADKVEEEGEVKQTVEQREEKKVKARRRMLGNIRLIGELYKKKMLTERIMHECIKKLLGQCQDPDEEDIEALCKLMSTIGEVIDQPRAKEHMDAYFEMMFKLSSNQKLSSRLRFMLKDVIDLRINRWQQRRKIEGPKKIEEVHRDAAQERQAQASRSSRGPVINSSARRGPPVDYGSHGPTAMSASGLGSQQMGSLRFQHSVRGLSVQDVRMEDRHLSESRTPSVPLPQRSINNDSITLGPQGGLAKGMSLRGQHLTSEEPRRAILGPNISSSREELIHRNPVDKFASISSERPVSSERNPYSSNRDPRNLDNSSDRSLSATSTANSVHRSSGGHQSTSSVVNPLSEERLKEKSISTIREYYSAKDEREVALCIKELNSPNFSSSIVSLWVTDSFERKDIEREQLTSLLINLSRSPHSLFSQTHLMQGFESVLSSLEDAVNDAPKATQFLGRMLAKVILENVIPFRDIGRLIREGGEEPGRLLEIGLAADVLASILEIIKAEKGDSALKEMQRSHLRLEDFRPPLPTISKKLEAFL